MTKVRLYRKPLFESELDTLLLKKQNLEEQKTENQRQIDAYMMKNNNIISQISQLDIQIEAITGQHLTDASTGNTEAQQQNNNTAGNNTAQQEQQIQQNAQQSANQQIGPAAVSTQTSTY